MIFPRDSLNPSLPQVMKQVALSFKTATCTTSQVAFFPKTEQSRSKVSRNLDLIQVRLPTFCLIRKFAISWDGLLEATPHWLMVWFKLLVKIISDFWWTQSVFSSTRMLIWLCLPFARLPQLLVLALAQIGGVTRLQKMTILTESVFRVSLNLIRTDVLFSQQKLGLIEIEQSS